MGQNSKNLRSCRIAISYGVIVLAAYAVDYLAFIPYKAAKSFGWYVTSMAINLTFLVLMYVILCRVFGEKPGALLGLGEGPWWLLGTASVAACSGYIYWSMIRNAWNITYTVILFHALTVAFFEELLFRGILCTYAMKLVRKPCSIFYAILGNGLFFGMMHLLNLMNGQSMKGTIIQVTNAFCVGFLLGALFVRTRSIWPGFAIHFINNYGIYLSEFSGIEAQTVIHRTLGEALAPNMMATVKWTLLYIIPAILLLSDKCCGGIFRMWHRGKQ